MAEVKLWILKFLQNKEIFLESGIRDVSETSISGVCNNWDELCFHLCRPTPCLSLREDPVKMASQFQGFFNENFLIQLRIIDGYRTIVFRYETLTFVSLIFLAYSVNQS